MAAARSPALSRAKKQIFVRYICSWYGRQAVVSTSYVRIVRHSPDEVIEKELFDILRKKHGKEFHSFMGEKVCAVPGDIAYENLGIKDRDMRELLWKDINIVIHVAATTNFFVRYDIALNINVLGAKHVMNFAKQCNKLEVFLHVSTAYVTKEKEGLLLENAFSMGEALKDNMHLDIDAEIKLGERKKKELQCENTTMEVEKMAMKELGIERARHFGWPNTYVFTKAMGEMLLGKLRGNLPLVIARPTIITSTWKEPFPGWIEGNRTIDNIIVGYAKGNLAYFAADTESPMDVMLRLVNAIFCCLFSKKYGEFRRKYKFLTLLIDLYTPYCFKGRFDDINLERLRMATKKNAKNEIFYFDPKSIDWDEYFYSTHIPGVLKRVCN